MVGQLYPDDLDDDPADETHRTWGITDVEDLVEASDCSYAQEFGDVRLGFDVDFKLMNDLDLRLYEGAWVPLQLYSTTIDGGHYEGSELVVSSIKGLSIPGADPLAPGDLGLFEYIEYSTIKNLDFENIGEVNGCGTVGILGGRSLSSHFENINVFGTPETTAVNSVACLDGDNYFAQSIAGGLIGRLEGGTLTDVNIDGVSVSAEHVAGGIAGQTSQVSFDNIYGSYLDVDLLKYTQPSKNLRFSGTVRIPMEPSMPDVLEVERFDWGSLHPSAGGLFGNNGYLEHYGVDFEQLRSGLKVVNSTASGKISGQSAGGLIGVNHGIISNSSFGGVGSGSSVRGLENVGGLVGEQTYVNDYRNSNLARFGEILGFRIADVDASDSGTEMKAFFAVDPHILSAGDFVQLSGLSGALATLNGTHQITGVNRERDACDAFDTLANYCTDGYYELGWFSLPLANSSEIVTHPLLVDSESEDSFGFRDAVVDPRIDGAFFTSAVGVFNSVVVGSSIEGLADVGGAIGSLENAWVRNLAVVDTKILIGLIESDSYTCSNSDYSCDGIGGVIGDAWSTESENFPSPLAHAESLSFNGSIEEAADSVLDAEVESYISAVGGIVGYGEYFGLERVDAYFDLVLDNHLASDKFSLADVGGVFGLMTCSNLQNSRSDMSFNAQDSVSLISGVGGLGGRVTSNPWGGYAASHTGILYDRLYARCYGQSTYEGIATQVLGSSIELGPNVQLAYDGQVTSSNWVGQFVGILENASALSLSNSAYPLTFVNLVSRGRVRFGSESVQAKQFGQVKACTSSFTFTQGFEQNGFAEEEVACSNEDIQLTNALVGPATDVPPAGWRIANHSDNWLIDVETDLDFLPADFASLEVGDSVQTAPTLIRSNILPLTEMTPTPRYEVIGFLPTGLTLDPDTSVILGELTQVGAFSFRVLEHFGQLQTVSPWQQVEVAPASAPESTPDPTPTVSATPQPSPSTQPPSTPSPSPTSSPSLSSSPSSPSQNHPAVSGPNSDSSPVTSAPTNSPSPTTPPTLNSTQIPTMPSTPAVKPLVRLSVTSYTFTNVTNALKEKVANNVKKHKTKKPKQVECRVQGANIRTALAAAKSLCAAAKSALGANIAVKPVAVLNRNLKTKKVGSVKVSG